MKHSKYVMAGLWEVPESITSPVAISWDKDGKPKHFTQQPAFIAAHQTAPHSMAEGFIICCRKLEIDPMLN